MSRPLLLALLALFALPAVAQARAGAPDPRFGERGGVLLGRGGGSLTGGAVAVQSDNRVIAAGSDGRSLFVARLRVSGAPDPSFGRRGRVGLRVRGAASAGARDVEVFRDGRILVGGTAVVRGVRRLVVARLLPGGSLDPNFGSSGIAVVGPRQADFEAMALQPEGELVIAGSVPGDAGRVPLAIRLFADGAPDPDFGVGGTADLAAAGVTGRARDVLVLPSGRIALALAAARGRAARGDFVAARLTSAGALDPTFDEDGIARVRTTSGAVRDGGAAALVLAPGGRLVLGGTARGSGGRDDAVAVRLTAAGRADRGFGRAGVARVGDRRGRSLRIAAMRTDSRRRLVLAGHSARRGAVVLRLLGSGRPDRAFGANGLSGGRPRRAAFTAVAVRRDGAVLAAGTARARGRRVLAVTRLRGH